MLENEIAERMQLIERILYVYKIELEEEFPDRILRGPVQRFILKKLNLCLSGCHKRAVNEAFALLGYKKVSIRGWRYYRKIS